MKNIKRLFIVVLAMLAAMAIASPSLAEYDTQMYVTCNAGEFVRMREEASTSSDTVIKLHNGDPVKADRHNSTWHKIKYVSGSSTYTGYMMSSFLTTTNPGQSTATGWESRYGTRTYSKSSTKYELFKNVQADLNKYFELTDHTWVAVYPLDVDGIMGDASEVAVMLFQQYEGLLDEDNTPDGIVGPQTKARLYECTH